MPEIPTPPVLPTPAEGVRELLPKLPAKGPINEILEHIATRSNWVGALNQDREVGACMEPSEQVREEPFSLKDDYFIMFMRNISWVKRSFCPPQV